MKIIFLDMDGVLCTYRATTAVREKGLMTYLDPIAVKLIERLVVDCSATIVISSTWRRHKSKEQMKEVFKAAGAWAIADAFHTEWATPLGNLRGAEIDSWLTTAVNVRGENIEKYVILDDMDEFFADQHEFFVECNTHDGIGFKEYLRARYLLTGERHE